MNTFTLWVCRYIWTHIQNTYLKNLELVDEFSNNTEWLICTWQHVGTWYFSSKELTVTVSICILSVEFNTCFFRVQLFIGKQLCQCRWEANWCVHPLEELRPQPQLGTTEFYSRKEAFEVILSGVCLNTHSLSPIRCNLSMAWGVGGHSAPAPCQLKTIIFIENDGSIVFFPPK